MASSQYYKPCDQTNYSPCHQKPTKPEMCHNKHTNEHSFTDKVKDMTHKIFDRYDHPNGHPAPNHMHKPTTTHGMKNHEKNHGMKKMENGHCMPKMHHKKKKKSHKRDGGCSSDSGSSSESDDDNCKRKF